MNDICAANVQRLAAIVSLRVQALLAVLDYSGEHNISITTNPYRFYLLFPCYSLIRACSLTLNIALPKIRYIHSDHNRKVVENSALFLFFCFVFFSFIAKRKENEELFWNKKVFWNVLFFLFCCDKKISHFTSKLISVPTSWKYLPQKSTKRKRKHATASYALTSV